MFGGALGGIFGGWSKKGGGSVGGAYDASPLSGGAFGGGGSVNGGGIPSSTLQLLVIVCILIIIFVIVWGVVAARRVAKQLDNMLPDQSQVASAYNKISRIIKSDDLHPQLQHMVDLVESGRMTVAEFLENVKVAISNLDVKNSAKLSSIAALVASADSAVPVADQLARADVPLVAAASGENQNEIIYHGNLPRPRSGDCAGREDIVKASSEEADALAVSDGNVAPYQENMVSNNAARRAKLTDGMLRNKLEQ